MAVWQWWQNTANEDEVHLEEQCFILNMRFVFWVNGDDENYTCQMFYLISLFHLLGRFWGMHLWVFLTVLHSNRGSDLVLRLGQRSGNSEANILPLNPLWPSWVKNYEVMKWTIITEIFLCLDYLQMEIINPSYKLQFHTAAWILLSGFWQRKSIADSNIKFYCFK